MQRDALVRSFLLLSDAATFLRFSLLARFVQPLVHFKPKTLHDFSKPAPSIKGNAATAIVANRKAFTNAASFQRIQSFMS